MSRRRIGSGATLARATAALLAVTFVSPSWAAPGDITMVPTPALGADPPRAHDITDGDATVSTMTGAFSYSYPIVVPPGRMGMQPELALTYTSQAPLYGGVAMGWSLQIPTIELDTSQSLAAAHLQGIAFGDGPFVSNLAGGRPLVQVIGDQAVPTATKVLEGPP